MRLGRALLGLLIDFRAAISGGSTLLDGLVSYWPLNEVSGVRYDAVGANDLTDNNTVGSKARGPIGTVARMVQANDEYLSATVAIANTQAYTLAFWLRDRSTTSQRVVFSIDSVAYYNESSGLYVYGSSAGVVTGSGTAIDWADNQWHLIVFQQSGTTSKVSIDGQAFLTKAGNTPPANGSYLLKLGQAFSALYAIDGDQACAGFWDAAIDDAAVASLYNSGNAPKYADLSTGLKTSLVSYWDMDEASGVRYDSHGSNDLTDNNTVGSTTNAGDAMDGGAASFVKLNSESLSVADTADLSGGVGKSYTFSLWMKPAVVTGDNGVFCKGDSASASTLEYFLEQYEDDLYWYVGNATTASYATKVAKIATEVWAHIICGFNASTGKGFLSVNNDAQTLSGQLPGDAMLDGAGAFRIGRYGGTVYYGGQVDEFAVWNRVLTADERTELYNAGAGKYYDFS